MESILILGVGLLIGWIAREIYAVYSIKKLIIQVEEYESLQSLPKIEPILIDKHNDTLLVYSKVDNSFMAQGKNIKELESNLSSRFPGKKFAATPENLKEVGITHNV